MAAAALLTAVPVARELVEDAVHLIADGHLTQESCDQDELPGQCCTGLFHACACHAFALGTLAPATTVLSAGTQPSAMRAYSGVSLRPGFQSELLRPPIFA